jgi:MFS family permease
MARVREGLRSVVQVMRGAFGTPALARLQLAFAASSLSYWGGFIALSVYAFNEAGAAAVGVIAFAKLVPAALATPATSLLADRSSRRNVLVVSSVARCAFGLGLAGVAASAAPLAVVALFAVAQAVAQTAYRPAQAALMPQLASSPQQMAAANAVWNGLESAAFVLGALLGGWAIGALDPGLAFGLLALPLALAALLLLGIPRDPTPEYREVLAGARLRDEALIGYRTVLGEPQLRTLVGVMTLSKLAEGAVDTLIVLVALDLLGLAESSVGVFNAAWGLGGVLGMIVALGLLHRGTLAAGLALGCIAIGAPLVALGGLATAPAAGIALFVLGIGYALVEIAGETLLQRLASDEVLARVFGVLEGTYLAATGVGALLAPVLAHVLGIAGAVAAVGAAMLLLAALRWRALARYEAGTVIPEHEFRLLRGVALFAPLPVAAVENLALRLDVVPMHAGEAVITQGEDGDRFYVIDAGEVEIFVDDVPRRVQGPGECFGEIALLHEVPRTATVRARTDGRLVALEREEFLANVTGNQRASNAATRLISDRLDGDAPARRT